MIRKVTFEKRPEGDEGVSHANISEKYFQEERTKGDRQKCAGRFKGAQRSV